MHHNYISFYDFFSDNLPTPQAARYNRAGDPNPPAPTTTIDAFKRLDCPVINKENTSKR